MVQRLISFFGPDGTGKSTHAEVLVNCFQSYKIKVRKVWIRSPHTLAYLLSRFFVKMGVYRVVSNGYGVQTKIPAVHSNRCIRLFWSITELISVLPVILVRVYIPLVLGYTIVAERYVVDTVVNIAYLINDLGFLQSRTARILLCFVPSNTVFIYLDSDYSAIMKRRGKMVDAYDFIKFQRIGYKMIGKSVGAMFIDTSNASVEQISRHIMYWLRISGVFESKT